LLSDWTLPPLLATPHSRANVSTDLPTRGSSPSLISNNPSTSKLGLYN
jgi:hypothetical protein